jgi:hypothetical protein
MEKQIEVKTNNHWWDLSDKERAELDYIVDDKQDWWQGFRYKSEVYDLGEFVNLSAMGYPESLKKDWHGIQTESFFSGIVVRYTDDHGSVIVGSYCC